MACSSAALRPPIVIAAATFLLLTTTLHAKMTPTVAPGPTPAPINLTAILEKGSQYTTLLRLLKDTQVGSQIQSQLNNSFDGLTIFAPTDNAFSTLKPGTLNGLKPQDQVALVLYHVLPRYYSLPMFETVSNPVRTQASGNNGVYTVNIIGSNRQVNVSTGVDETQISNELYTEFPLAVYSVGSVLLPNDIFGVKPPASAPAPSLALDPKKPEKGTPKVPSADATASPSAASFRGKSVEWGFMIATVFVWVAGVLI